MASFNFNEGVRALITGGIDLDTDTFKEMLVTVAPDETAKDTWTSRSNVTNEVANGNGYATGGNAVTLTVLDDDDANNDVEISADPTLWPASTIAAVGSIIYAVKGSAATDIPLSFVDFGGTVNSTADTFTSTKNTNLKFQN